jgi:hypothetical protein
MLCGQHVWCWRRCRSCRRRAARTVSGIGQSDGRLISAGAADLPQLAPACRQARGPWRWAEPGLAELAALAGCGGDRPSKASRSVMLGQWGPTPSVRARAIPPQDSRTHEPRGQQHGPGGCASICCCSDSQAQRREWGAAALKPRRSRALRRCRDVGLARQDFKPGSCLLPRQGRSPDDGLCLPYPCAAPSIRRIVVERSSLKTVTNVHAVVTFGTASRP